MTDINEKMRRANLGGKTAAKRTRPTVQANNLRKNINNRPMPKPPQRHANLQAASTTLNEEQTTTYNRLKQEFERLEENAQLSDVYRTIGDLDKKLISLPADLEKMRARGYAHGGYLEDQLETLSEKWSGVRPKVEQALKEHVERLDKEAEQVERQVNLASRNASLFDKIESGNKSLSSRISAAQTAVSSLYDGIESELYQIDRHITAVGKMLDLIDGSPEFRLRDTEGPLLAIASEWQKDGKEGPDGFIFLTDQRLVFEQREEIVTKKRFGLFKADSEKVQDVLLDIPAHDIQEVSHAKEGGFIGMGKKDILELVFAASAPVSRARFHLQGQDGADWAAMIKKIQNGEIGKERAADYEEDVAGATELALAFPSQCPGCYASIATPPRGVLSVTCEFCGTVIKPEK